MSSRSLPEFLDQLDDSGVLSRVTVEVSAEGEIAEIVRRVGAAANNAVLFENVTGKSATVASLFLGSERRVCQALGIDRLEQAGNRLVGDAAGGGSFLKRLASEFFGRDIDAVAPRSVKTAACQQVVRLGRDVDLFEIPALRHSADDAAPTISAAYVISTDQSGDERQLTKIDLPVLDRNRLGITWHPHDDLARHFSEYKRSEAKMPIAVVLGGPPSALLASFARFPEPVDGLLVAGVLADEPVDVVTCRTNSIQVPAEAEFVIEGTIDPSESPMPIGPMTTSDGSLRTISAGRAVEVVQVTHRSDPVFPTFIHHVPPNEETIIARCVERILLPMWRLRISGLVDFDRPLHSGRDKIAFASVRNTFSGQSRAVANALRGEIGTLANKLLVLVDDDVDLCDEAEVWRRVAQHVGLDRDLILSQMPVGGVLGERPHFDETTLTIDATRKPPGPTGKFQQPTSKLDAPSRELVDRRWPEYGIED